MNKFQKVNNASVVLNWALFHCDVTLNSEVFGGLKPLVDPAIYVLPKLSVVFFQRPFLVIQIQVRLGRRSLILTLEQTKTRFWQWC